MVRRNDVDDRIAHAPTERVVNVPEAEDRRPGGLRASVAPWMIFFAVGVIAAVSIFALVLSRANGVDEPPAPLTGEGATTDADLDGYRTQTVNVDEGLDVLALSAIPASLTPYHGAPFTADGVVVQEVFGPDAFTVASPTGVEMLVYLAPMGEPELPTVIAGQELTFLGTLMPVRPDFSFLVGPTAATAAPSGTYLYAVPETIRLVTPYDA